MKNLFLSLVFMLVGSFTFSLTSNFETSKTENSVSINLDNQLMREMPLIVLALLVARFWYLKLKMICQQMLFLN